MLSEEAVHVSPMEVMPILGKGTLGTWWFCRSAGRSDSAPTMSLTCEMELGLRQTTEVGAYANQRLNLTKLGRPKEEARTPNRTWEIRPYGIIGGPRET